MFLFLSIVDHYDHRCKTFVLIVSHDLSWNGLDMCSKLLSKCLPFRACLWAFLSAFSWRFCLVGLSVYSYPGLEAHVCDGLSGCKQYVSCFNYLLVVYSVINSISPCLDHYVLKEELTLHITVTITVVFTHSVQWL